MRRQEAAMLKVDMDGRAGAELRREHGCNDEGARRRGDEPADRCAALEPASSLCSCRRPAPADRANSPTWNNLSQFSSVTVWMMPSGQRSPDLT
jgi:hypothetical protein